MSTGAGYWLKQVYLCCVPAYPIGYLLIHGFRDDHFFTKFYVERSALEPSSFLTDLVESELDKIEDTKQGKVRLTLTDRTNPRTYGGLFLTRGVELQLPINFSFIDVEHARRYGANLEMDLGLARNRRKLDVNSEIGDELVSRMMLSDEAKKFVVRRELELSNSGILFFSPVLSWVGVWSVGYILLNPLSMLVGPILAVGSSALLSLMSWTQLKTSIEKYTVTRADQLPIEKDAQYLIGARDYFTSSLKLNRLLRKVLGEEGEKCIKKNGDSSIDVVPLTARLHFVEKYASELLRDSKEGKEKKQK